MKNYSSKTIQQTLLDFNSSLQGLNNKEAEQRTYQQKPNTHQKSNGVVSKFFQQFFDLMIIILLLASVMSIVIGIVSSSSSEIVDGAIILFIVLMNAIFGVVQEYKAEKSLQALEKIIQKESFVLRENNLLKIPSDKLVEGDIVCLKTGDIVPADLRLIETVKMKVDESSLTGESNNIEKNANEIFSDKTSLGERKNMAYKGTNITCGHGKGIVVGVGENTEFGKIESVIKHSEKSMTPLQKNIKEVGKVLTFLVLAIAVVTFIIEICIDPKNILDAFLTSVAISVAAIPESMPAVITIIMSLGVARLAKQKAIVKKLHSVETLGSCDVICSDKTGTITKNKMTVSSLFLNGAIAKNIQKEKGTKPLFQACVLCNDAKKVGNSFSGDATEVALMDFCEQQNILLQDFLCGFQRINEIPFSSSRKMMSVLVEKDGQKQMFCKGALDRLIEKCRYILINNQIYPLDMRLQNKILQANDKVSNEAQRVLGIAFKSISNEKDFNENDMVFVGFVGMIDPPRPEIENAVSKCEKAGMKAVMITGDYQQTAFAIAKKVGIAHNKKQVLTGEMLSNMTDDMLEKNINKYSVFARVSPNDKVRIVEAFKKKGHIVAMTGDGVNDAPSIKRADIGIGMGQTGTDVAKEVADLIVTDDNFATIIIAVEEGRKIYQNIQKTVKFLFSANLAELFSLFIVTLLYPQFVFLMPVQILFVNLITDSLPAIALGLEEPENDLMKVKPRKRNSSIFSNGMGVSIVVLGIVQTLLVVLSYVLGVKFFDDKIASTIAFYTLNIIQMFYLASMRTNVAFFKSKPWKNKFFLLAVLFCFAIVFTVAFSPLGELLNIAKIDIGGWIIVFACSVAMFIFSELYKFIENKKRLNKII